MSTEQKKWKMGGDKPIRVYVDGCFDVGIFTNNNDLMHFGHANAMRQARELGDILVVGVHTDAEIARNKGPPVMNEQERYKAVRACKWADEVAEGAPYTATVELLKQLNCDFCVHGEDISVGADGKDVYETIKNSGMFRYIKRTEGVSTTELVGRMLLLTKDHLQGVNTVSNPLNAVNTKDLHRISPYTSLSHFLPTTRKIVQFSEGKSPKPNDKIVYMDGGFDVFHVGHTEALRQAKELGDFLIVGVHDDAVVNEQKGSNFPIMNLHERVLSVLSCRYVDEVVIGAPFNVTKEMIEGLHINTVVHGDDPVISRDGLDPYKVPKELGIYKEIKHTEGLTTTDIIRRIIDNRIQFEARNKKKEQKEVTFIQNN
ncbi:phosphoethanolamine-cytidyltransferase [Heterostelium album PN500]|uniref:ethanolamine-phosphate cytidylyltransferase n=1 Tax=Heterostelium pallidum (strain ATCC 26659 / Pp 5 / PN500) TaxID=670386 RepID=D3BEU0_HETP5|nr:phosphoethanolamine-cytidyltransferase [Heterostelium album PN500]EFA80421.1 phosphoethanolamine-cytidyltransferase [Heterostelium album PN500]|eukprot:XP_020432541.1 phosphoethanolamine-cytidyltransferase [Heterostelium album PN500]